MRAFGTKICPINSAGKTDEPVSQWIDRKKRAFINVVRREIVDENPYDHFFPTIAKCDRLTTQLRNGSGSDGESDNNDGGKHSKVYKWRTDQRNN